MSTAASGPSSTSSAPPSPASGNPLQLALATGAFAVCFSVFGSMSAMMPIVRERLSLTPMQVSVAIALPVILGSVGRLPLGMLTDRYGARLIFSLTMAASVIASALLARASDYPSLLLCSFFAGISLASFAVGVGFVSRWYPPHHQGMALGVYGVGNIGQSLAAFGAPWLAGVMGYAWGFWAFALVTTAWMVLFAIKARNAPTACTSRTLKQMLQPMRTRQSWLLSVYYFLTFGGFVSMSIYLPMFLTDMFKLTPTDAGLRTAGFVLLATLVRPLGGRLADRLGGQVILACIFPIIAVFALCLACPLISTFTLGALGMAVVIGLGNGAVFKLVPQYYPQSIGSVTGLVGAAGGMGGFFPPLLVGTLHHLTGHYAWGFVLLALASLGCLALVMHQRRSIPAMPLVQEGVT